MALPRGLRIEMVLPSLVTGGMEAVVARLARALHAQHVEVGFTLTVEEGAFAAALRRDGFAVNLVPQPRRFASVRIADLERHFRERRPDVVHAHSGVWLRAARAAHRGGRYGVVHTVHGLLTSEPRHGPLLKRLAMRYTDEVVAVSPSLADYLREHVHIDANRVRVIANGVDTTAFRPVARSGALRAEFEIPAHAVLIGAVARLDPVKNHGLILRALSKMVAAGTDAHVLFVGDGPERARLEATVAALSLTERVHFAGVRRVDSMLYADLDVFALPSFLEGTSISLLEAMACGLPAIATRVGGTIAVLDGSPFPGAIPSDDVVAFSDVGRRLATDPALRMASGSWMRQRVLNHYSESAMVAEYLACYHRVMAHRARRVS